MHDGLQSVKWIFCATVEIVLYTCGVRSFTPTLFEFAGGNGWDSAKWGLWLLDDLWKLGLP